MSALLTKLRAVAADIMPVSGGLWHWWQNALLSWLPARWRLGLGLNSNARLLFKLLPEGLELIRENEQTLTSVIVLPWPITPQEFVELVPLRLRNLPRYWLLPSECALRCRLRLPAAAANQLQNVTRFEIDRQTPFQADHVYHDARIIDRTSDNQLNVELVAVPRRVVHGPGGIAQEWMSTLAGLDVADAQANPLGVNILPADKRLRRQDPFAIVKLSLIAVIITLVCLLGGLILDNRHKAAEHLRQEIVQESQRARSVSSQRQQYIALIDGARFFAQLRAQHPPVVAIWNALTHRLPENTYLEKFSIEGDQLQLIGMSHEAASLIRRLENEQYWKKPTLNGVLQSDAGSGLDRFTITAQLPRSDANEGEDATATE